MEAILLIIAIVFFLAIIVWVFRKLIKKLEIPEIEWFGQNEIPTRIRVGRSLSEDVLVMDLDLGKIQIGYYSYSNECWILSNNPKKFIWAYID